MTKLTVVSDAPFRLLEDERECKKLVDDLTREHASGEVRSLLYAYYGPTGRMFYAIGGNMGIEQLAWAVSMLQAILNKRNLSLDAEAKPEPPEPPAA